MSRISKNKLLSAASAITIATFATPATQAQEAEVYEEEITVTGIRGSIRGSIEDKRNAEQVVDTIVAEDIGKSTDKNIAEALNRVPGVSITEQGGEGAFVSIRGASPEQTVVTLNGNALGTTEFGQSVNLSSYSADILSKIEVIKTPSADNEEGALGGLVNLVTRKPLELTEDVRSVGIEGRWNSQYNEDNDPNNPLQDYRLTASFSDTFADDTLGFIVTLVDEKNPTRQDFIEGRNWDSARSFNAETLDGTVYQADGYSSPSLWGIAARQTAYGVRQGQRDRQAVDFAGQWQPTDQTSITMNVNYALQQVENTRDEVTIRNNDQSRSPNHNGVGVPSGFAIAGVQDVPTPFQDPSSWMVLDPDTRTWVRTQRRFDSGDINASSDIFENENTTVSLELEQSLFDDSLRINVGASSQKAEQIPDQRVFLNLQSGRENPEFLRFFIPPEDLQAQGVDCSRGECVPITGETFIGLGNIVTQPSAEQVAALSAAGILGTVGQAITTRNDDNVSFTGLNPDDLRAFSVGNLNQTLTAVEDTNDVVYFDADFDFDKLGITTLEFGAKYTKREKFVDDQSGGVTNRNAAASIANPLTGEAVLVANALDQTPLQSFEEQVSPNGFLSGLGLDGNAISDGFVSVDPVAVFELVRNDEGIAIDIDNTETRSAEFDNLAAYLKASFSFMDDRLTGNIGARYVETEVVAAGSSGISAFNESFGRNQRVHDIRNLRENFMDTSNPACPDIPTYDGGIGFGDEARYARVDGLGIDTNGTATFNDDTPLAAATPCHEPTLVSLDALQASRNGTSFSQALRRYNNVFWTNNDIFTGGFATTDTDGLNLAGGTNNTIRSFASSRTHEYSELLPSLNLSYLLNDDMILRFAASKTMTRPPIDQLRPGFSISETGWGNPATRTNSLTLFDTTLEPLTSKNLDLSFEWYFDEDALLGIGVFRKDLENLIENEQQSVYLRDVKSELQNGEDIDPEPASLILSEDTITLDNCYAEILGEWQYGYNPEYVENMFFSDDPQFLCAQFNAEQPRNASGASITGLELQYTQSYTMLPGVLSGLGLSANYTYQDSSFDKDTSDLVEGLSLPRFQIDRTPEHSYNLTAFWQSDVGHQLRLAYSGTTDQLLQRNFEKGTLWAEGRDSLDFSAAYQVNDAVSLTFDVTNILDDPYRQYFTSQTILLPQEALDGGTALVAYSEADQAIDGNAYKGRTVSSFTTGQTYRLGLRLNF